MTKALIVVDYQFDFADPQGTLYVPGGELLKDKIIARIKEYRENNNLVIFSQDWHPLEHISFKEWPVHCVRDTLGAQLCIAPNPDDLVIKKGININEDSYSAFYIGKNIKSALNNFLLKNKINELEICGLALDICVNATYLDALRFKYKASVNLELSKPIDKNFILGK
ncbi:isochorismatase family protein [Spiroplasma endosymbiont of Aspidapion aeneum]|uniref:isochorismatase family protein n=1 Tax=Spiroplasma endosymbiont of Aspidapion aeneum TaxID=3066276 RepID=UPI00313EC306